MYSRCLSAGSLRFLALPVPTRGMAFLAVGLLCLRRDPVGVAVFRTVEMQLGWVSSLLREYSVSQNSTNPLEFLVVRANPPLTSYSAITVLINHIPVNFL